MKVCLDLHDFSVAYNRLDVLMRLKDHFPDFKVSLFTIPMESKADWGPYLTRSESLRQITKNLDWIQIIPHGLRHEGSEMRYCSYYEFKDRILPTIQEALANDGLPYIHGFCAPHWRWSDGVIRVLNEMGWWGAIDRRQPYMLRTKRFYRYSHCIDEKLPQEAEVLKLHGHVYGTTNDLERCLDNIFGLTKLVEWHFVTDFIEENP